MSRSPYHHEQFTWKDYLKAVFWGVVISLVALLIQKAVETEVQRPVLAALSNAFLAAAAIQLGGGLLSYIKYEGFFDVMFFGFKQLFYTLGQSIRGEREMTYLPADINAYKDEMEQKRRVNIPWLVSGGVFMLLSIILALVFSRLY